MKLEPEALMDLGDRLLVSGYWTGQGRSSGVPFKQRFFQVFTLKRGLVIRQKDFTNRDEAMAGLRAAH